MRRPLTPASARALARALVALVLVLSTVVATPPVASAQTEPTGPSDTERAAARDLGEKALAAYQSGEFDEAHDLFKRAHAIVGLTTTGLFIARCLVKLNRFVEASERYVEVARMTLPPDALPQHIEAKETAQTEREALVPRIPRLQIVLDDPEATDTKVTLDGVEVPGALLGVSRPVDPGSHVIVGVRGELRREETVALAEGQTLKVTLAIAGASPAPLPVPPPTEPDQGNASLLQTLGFIALGIGGAGLVVGAVTGGLAIDKRSSLESACDNKQCAPDLHGDVDTYGTLRIVSGVGLIAGGVLAAAGIVLVVVGSTTSTEGTTAVRLGPTGVALTGSF